MLETELLTQQDYSTKSSQMLGYHLSQQALADVKNYTWDRRAQNILEFIK